MAFWSDELSAGTEEPKRKFRFRISFTGLTEDGIVWYAKTVNKPNFTVTETEHTFLNHKFYYPGRVEWQEISMTLVDPVSPNASAQLSALIRASGYKPLPGKTGLETMSKAKSAGSLGVIEIQQIDANGQIIEIWRLINPFIKSVKYGDLDYGNDELLEIELGLRYDWAELITPGTRNVLQDDGSFADGAVPSINSEIIGGTIVEDGRKLFTTEGPGTE